MFCNILCTYCLSFLNPGYSLFSDRFGPENSDKHVWTDFLEGRVKWDRQDEAEDRRNQLTQDLLFPARSLKTYKKDSE